MRLYLLVSLLLATFVLADNTITMSCTPCYVNEFCATVNGAGFSSANIRVSNDANYCKLFTNGPSLSVSFGCNSVCFPGCQMILVDNGVINDLCTEKDYGQEVTNWLNDWYRRQSNGTEDYDWCNCDLSTAAIIGITIGSLVVFVALICVIACCCKNCGKGRSY